MSVHVHFLNVGHGDCTIVEFDSGRLAMIDINNSKSLPEEDEIALAKSAGVSLAEFRQGAFAKRSWEEYYRSLLVDPYDYYRANFDGRPIFRYIQTHPDMDHMSGLHRFFWQEKVELLNFWDLDHAKKKEESEFEGGRYSYLDWLVYLCLRAERGPDETSHKVLRLMPGAEGQYYLDDGITILGPDADLIETAKTTDVYNNASYVVRLDYGGRRLLLPGDIETAGWRSVMDNFGVDALACDILKASHHGRQSGYDEKAALAMLPDAVVCSVGKKPDTDASDEYQALGAKVFSTRYCGTIKMTMWGDGEVWMYNHKGERIFELPPLT